MSQLLVEREEEVLCCFPPVVDSHSGRRVETRGFESPLARYAQRSPCLLVVLSRLCVSSSPPFRVLVPPLADEVDSEG